jgi:hypothetical protein
MSPSSTDTIEHVYLPTAKPFDEVRANLERHLGRFDPDVQTSLAAGAQRKEERYHV